MRLNGRDIALETAIPLLQVLEKFQYDPAKIAVERNGDIIPKKNSTKQRGGEVKPVEARADLSGN